MKLCNVGYELWKSTRNSEEIKKKRIETEVAAGKRCQDVVQHGQAEKVVEATKAAEDSDKRRKLNSAIEAEVKKCFGDGVGRFDRVSTTADDDGILKMWLENDTTFTLWFPRTSGVGKPKSPLTYVSNLQRFELLYRSAPLSCVVSRRGRKTY